MAQKIEIVRGTTNTFQIAVTDADGREYTPADGEVIVFGIKKKLDDVDAIVVKTATDSVVTIAPSDTADLDPGRYFYDVGLKSGTDYFSVIEPNPFIIQANVTKWGDGA